MRLALVALVLLLAGCTQPAATPRQPRVITLPFQVPQDGNATGLPGGTFVVPPGGAQRLLLAANWTCESAACGLDIDLYQPGGGLVATASGDSAATAAADQPAAGQWGVTVFAKEAGERARGEVRVTLQFAT